MNVKMFQKISTPEISLLVVFIIYILFPITTPAFMAPLVDSPLGYLSIFIITVLLFVYTSPLLGILYIFVAYELIRRSSTPTMQQVAEYAPSKYTTEYMPTHVPKAMTTQFEKDVDLILLNPTQESTLEEEIVQIRAPIGKSNVSPYSESSFKPVAENISNASLYV
jgi:predicted membrane protein